MNHELQRALADAAWDGDHLTVAALLDHPGVDPAAHHSAALLHAAHRGHWRCVELLLPVSDPNARNSEALWRAVKHRHIRVVQLLATVSDTAGWEGWMWQEIHVSLRSTPAHLAMCHGEKRKLARNRQKALSEE